VPKYWLLLIALLTTRGFAEDVRLGRQCERVTRPALSVTQVRSLIQPCFEKDDRPFVVVVQATLTKDRIQLTRLKNLGVFFAESEKNDRETCLFKSLEGAKPDGWNGFEKFMPWVPVVNIQLSRKKPNAPIEVASEMLCTNRDTNLHREDAKPLGDAFQKVGTPIEGALNHCGNSLPKDQKTGVYIGESEIQSLSSYGKKKTQSVHIDLPGLDKKYSTCVASALLKGHRAMNQHSPTERVVIDGQEKPSLPSNTIQASWFVVSFKDGKALHYEWEKIKADDVPAEGRF
jgi:hypothetical protein